MFKVIFLNVFFLTVERNHSLFQQQQGEEKKKDCVNLYGTLNYYYSFDIVFHTCAENYECLK